VWSPRRDRLAVSTPTAAGPRITIFNHGRAIARFAGYDPTWAPSGTKLAFVRRAAQEEIHLIGASGSGDRLLTLGTEPDWSPRGNAIVFTRYVANGLGDIWRINADGRKQRPLTSDAYGEDHPRWRPDGRRIAFVWHNRFPNANAELMTVSGDGSGRRAVTARPLDISWIGGFAWSPNGGKIAFTSSGVAAPAHDRG
jgi:Tol biopolymer transport system component